MCALRKKGREEKKYWAGGDLNWGTPAPQLTGLRNTILDIVLTSSTFQRGTEIQPAGGICEIKEIITF